MSKTVPRASTGSNGDSAAISLTELATKAFASSQEPAPRKHAVDDSVTNDDPINTAASGVQSSGWAHCKPAYNKNGSLPKTGDLRTEVDVIGIAAIGADPVDTWRANRSHTRGSEFGTTEGWSTEPWILRDIRRGIPKARVLLYDGHRKVNEGERLKDLAGTLLRYLHALRQYDQENRPFFLVCHSTGGLVAKLALIEASRGDPRDKILLADCFGIAYFATPHQGSSYLSLPEFSMSIVRAMRLKDPLPESIRTDCQVNLPLLKAMAESFRSLAADLSIWTFYETEDTDLTIPMTADTEEIPMLAPIASIRSAILDLYHENDYPMLTTHVGCASFSGESKQTRQDFLEELKQAVEKAHELSGVKHNDLKLKDKVKVEVHGFYKGIPSSTDSEAPIRLWSIEKSLEYFVREGPAKCLEQRLQEASVPPQSHQYLSSTTARAASLDVKPANDKSGASPNSALKRPQLAKGGNSFQRTSGVEKSVLEKNEDSSSREARKSPRRFLGSKKNSEEVIKPKMVQFQARNRNAYTPNRSSSSITNTPFPAGLRESIPEESLLEMISSPPEDQAQDAVEGERSLQVQQTAQETGSVSPARVPFATLYEPSQDVPLGLITPGAAGNSASRPRSPSVPNLSFPTPITRPIGKLGERRDSTGGFYPQARFVKPDVADRKLTWIHVPFNNPTWVAEVLSTVSLDKRNKSHEKLLDFRHWTSKHVRARHSEHHACFVKPGCLLVPHESIVKSPTMNPSTPNGNDAAQLQISLYLPYLHWDTYKMMIRRRYLIKKRLSHGRSRPVPDEVAKMDLEHRVTWDYLGHDPPFNCRRTLDQFGYPNLHDTRARDDDQMLYKMTKKRQRTGSKVSGLPRRRTEQEGECHFNGQGGPASDQESTDEEETKSDEDENVLDGTVLMVDQLWLWAISEDTTVTFFPRRESKPIDGRLHKQADLRNSIYNEVNGDLARRCENSLDLAALVVLHAVTIIFEGTSHSDLEVFRKFEESISILTEKMTQSFKDFRSLGFRDKSIDYDSDNVSVSIKAKHKLEGKESEKQNRDDTSALLELRDIHDELQSLHKLFEQQRETIDQMVKLYERGGYSGISGNGLSILQEAIDKLTGYTHQIDNMMKSAAHTRTDFEKLLDLKQRQANIDEARLARYQADLTSAQSRAVLVFTVFTVIFLPLTFFTGLFGMNISEWSGTTTNVSWYTVIEFSVPISLAITLSALIIALSPRVRKVAKGLGKAITVFVDQLEGIVSKGMDLLHIGTFWYSVANAIYDVVHKVLPWRETQSQRERKQSNRQGLKKAAYYDHTADFWANHIDRRENKYHIPRHNRKNKMEHTNKQQLRHRTTTWKTTGKEMTKNIAPEAINALGLLDHDKVHGRQMKHLNSDLRGQVRSVLMLTASREHANSGMLSRSAIRAANIPSLAARRGFHSTRARLSSPFHYPEGPRNNLPFNPLTKYFAFRYWATMTVGFSLPFVIAVWQTKKNK